MTSKKRRRRSSGARGGASSGGAAQGRSGSGSAAPPRGTAKGRSSSQRARSGSSSGGRSGAGRARESTNRRAREQEPPVRRGLFGGPSPVVGAVQPPFGLSVARGLTVVGSSPSMLASAFLAVLLMWIGAAAVTAAAGIALLPTAMAWYLALPPIHSLIDLPIVQAAGFSSPLGGLAAGVVLILFRTATMAFWCALAAWLLRGGAERHGAAAAGRTMAARFWRLAAIEAAFVALELIVSVAVILLGPSIGYLLFIAALLFGVYFLVFAPIIATLEQVRPREAFRLSLRAARLPGQSHALLVSAYLLLTVFLPLGAPIGRVIRATPDVRIWVFALLIGFLQVAALSAFVFRWLSVREAVLESVDVDPEASPVGAAVPAISELDEDLQTDRA